MSVWFDSRDVRYKDPFGAVSCGAEVRFALGADEPLEACCLLVRQEFAGLEQEVPLSPSGDGWSGVLTAPVEPELIWYAFRVRRPDGSLLWLGRNGCGGEADRQRWQLTVYEPTHTPDWFGRGGDVSDLSRPVLPVGGAGRPRHGGAATGASALGRHPPMAAR